MSSQLGVGNYDYTMVDDEFTDDLRISTSARAAYVSIKRHARITGYTDKPGSVLARGASIKKRSAWKRVTKELESLGYIKTKDRGQTKPPIIYLVPVKKSRPRPVRSKSEPHISAGVSPSGASYDRKGSKAGPKSEQTDNSTPRDREGERRPTSSAGPESGAGGRRGLIQAPSTPPASDPKTVESFTRLYKGKTGRSGPPGLDR